MASTSQSSLPLRISLTVLSIQIPVLQILSVPVKLFENKHYTFEIITKKFFLFNNNLITECTLSFNI